MYELINILHCIEKNKNLMILLKKMLKKCFTPKIYRVKMIVLLKMSYNWLNEA